MNDIPARPGSLICGLVEKGEKGLFFRKWFVCSRQFLLLWTMVCDPKDSSLKQNTYSNISFEHLRSSEEMFKKKSKIKSLDTLLEQLDTTCYRLDFSNSVKERQKRYVFHNLEKVSLYFSNRYKKICNVLFNNRDGVLNSNNYNGLYDDTDMYTNFQHNLLKNILWMTKLKMI